MERKFLVLLRRFSLRKEHHYFITFVCSFLRPHGDRGALVSAFGGSSNPREHTQAPSHSPLASLALAASALCVFAKWLLRGFVVTLKNMDCAKHKQICMCLPHPPSARTTIPVVFRRHYKTAGIAPLNHFRAPLIFSAVSFLLSSSDSHCLHIHVRPSVDYLHINMT
jgi:hypothetical protein